MSLFFGPRVAAICRAMAGSLILALFLPANLWADDLKVRNLVDIHGFQLVVERPTEDGLQVGIREEQIKNQVASLFKTLLPQVPLDLKDAPLLYVRVILYKRKKEDLYYGTVSVAVDRPVQIIVPGRPFPALAQVWDQTVVFSGRDPLMGTYEMVAKLIRLLIEDFKKANP